MGPETVTSAGSLSITGLEVQPVDDVITVTFILNIVLFVP